MTGTLSEALLYLAKGWSVFPIKARSKEPLVDWSEFQDRHATSEEVHRWWGNGQNHNIGIVTGKISGLVVVDVDVNKGGNSIDILSECITDLISETGTGGNHLFYEHPGGEERIRNRVAVRPGIDIRGDGGYVVAAPSIHPLTGKPYSWVKSGRPGTLPVWTRGGSRGPAGASPGNGIGSDAPKWLAEALGGVGLGERNSTAARLAGYFASKGIPKDVTGTLLQNWNSKNQAPLPARELATTLDSIYAAAKNSPLVLPPGDYSQARPLSPDFEQAHQQLSGQNPDTPFPLLSFGNFGVKYGANLEVGWTIRDWLPKSTIAFVISPPGSFKTWLTLDLAISVASGLPFLGQYPVDGLGPVMVLQQEDFLGDVNKRIGVILGQRFGLEWRSDGNWFEAPAVPRLPIYVHDARQLKFENTETVKKFAETVLMIKPRLVIIDPLYSATTSADFMAQAAERMFVLKQLRDRVGTSFVVVHHTSKGKGDKTRREQAWGSQFLNAFMETGWQVRPLEEGGKSIEVFRHFKTSGNPPPINLTFDLDPDVLGTYAVQTGGSNDSPEVKQIRDALSKPVRIQDLAKKLKWHHEKIRRILGGLQKRGLVERDSTGRFSWAQTEFESEETQLMF